MSKNVKDNAGVGSEPFPGKLLKPMKKDVNLPPEVLTLLVDYYHNAYSYPFVTLSNVHNSSTESIVVLPKINQFGRLRLGAEIFGSTFSKRYIRSANVLAQFILDDNTTDTYPGQVQFFFEHSIVLPEEGLVTHHLTFIRWYAAAEDRRSRFHCQIDKEICNIELWKNNFYELGRDCIIPIHNLLGRFVAGTVNIGKKNPKTYLSVIPINRKIHI
jgi:hypothetical protein